MVFYRGCSIKPVPNPRGMQSDLIKGTKRGRVVGWKQGYKGNNMAVEYFRASIRAAPLPKASWKRGVLRGFEGGER